MHRKHRIQSAIALLIGAALLVPVGSIAQTVSMARFVDRIAKSEMRPLGFQRPVPLRHGSLVPRSTIDQGFGLTKGQGYGFVAVGDDNANDVDLQLVDSKGKIIAQDNDTDESAVVTFSPQEKGKYYARVVMYGCQAGECNYAIGVYRGSKDLKRR